jgi:hypothetical protein
VCLSVTLTCCVSVSLNCRMCVSPSLIGYRLSLIGYRLLPSCHLSHIYIYHIYNIIVCVYPYYPMVYRHIYMCVCIYIYMYIHTHTFVYIIEALCRHIYIHTYIHTCIHTEFGAYRGGTVVANQALWQRALHLPPLLSTHSAHTHALVHAQKHALVKAAIGRRCLNAPLSLSRD